MLSNEDKLWIELLHKRMHDESDAEHREDHDRIMKVLDRAINKVYVVMVAVCVAMAVALAAIPFTISLGA